MSCFTGSLSADQKKLIRKSKKIDSRLARAMKKDDEKKLLLLGSGESGKSTIFKQMKILGADGFSESELKSFRPIIFSNCLTQIQALITAMELLDIEYQNPENEKIAEEILDVSPSSVVWTKEIAQQIGALWADEGIQNAYLQRDKEFQLNDSAGYFLSETARFEDPEFVPNICDVLRARVRTTGIEEAQFLMEDFQFRMLDVGGQRSERRKWIHCFDMVNAVIFCSSLSEYDQSLREDDSQNRMKESLLLFEEIRNSQWFRDVPFILFLNKIDLFREKIKKVSLGTCFEEYDIPAEKQTESQACEFIKKKFLEREDNQRNSSISTHFTCAINTDNVKTIFKIVKNDVFNKLIDEIMII